MRIGVEACTWANRRGYGRFTRQLVTSMIAEHPQHAFILVVDQQTAAACEFPSGAQVKNVSTRKQATQAASADSSRSLIDLWKMSRAVSRLKCDAFLFPTRYTFYPLFCKTPTVVIFHDATGELHPKLIFPGWKSRLFWKWKSRVALWNADQMVTVSQDARTQIATAFQLPESSIEVITEGPDPSFQPLTDGNQVARALLEKFRLPAEQPLILYVGGISPHKNLLGLLRALGRLRDLPWHLALVGDYAGDSFWSCHSETVDLAQTLGLTERVTFTGYVSDQELVLLYNVATMLVLPSMSEGFGLPVIEAMACGLPVAASNRNSLPEVVGDAGLLFDPLSDEQIAEAIARLLGDKEMRAKFSAAGLRRAELFSWKTASHKMVQIIEKVAGDGR